MTQAFLHPVFQQTTISVVGVILAIRESNRIAVVLHVLNLAKVQEILLSRFSLREYVLEAPRTSLVSANKEGIVSLLGTK